MTLHNHGPTFRQVGIRFIEDCVTGEIGVSLEKRKSAE